MTHYRNDGSDKMKVTYYLPAHPSYFNEGAYTQDEVDRAISIFKKLFKPEKLGEIPEEFVYLTQPGKDITAVFCSAGMKAPNESAEKRWLEFTRKIAFSSLEFRVARIAEFLKSKPQRNSEGQT